MLLLQRVSWVNWGSRTRPRSSSSGPAGLYLYLSVVQRLFGWVCVGTSACAQHEGLGFISLHLLLLLST